MLVEAGIEPDERVGLWGANEQGCDWIAALLAIQYAGAVPVPLTSGTALLNSADRLQRLGARHAVAAALAVPDLRRVSRSTRSPSPGLHAVAARPSHRSPAVRDGLPHLGNDRPAEGRADQPRIARLHLAGETEGHILAPPCGIDVLGPDDAIQTSIPLHTSSALEHYILLALWTGCRIVGELRFDPVETLQTAAAERSTIWLTVPVMMMLTADTYPEPVSGLDLRAVWHMGSVASRECIENTARMLPGCAVLNLYSLTESCAGIVTTHLTDAFEKPGATGRAVPPARIRVVDATGNPSSPTRSARCSSTARTCSMATTRTRKPRPPRSPTTAGSGQETAAGSIATECFGSPGDSAT